MSNSSNVPGLMAEAADVAVQVTDDTYSLTGPSSVVIGLASLPLVTVNDQPACGLIDTKPSGWLAGSTTSTLVVLAPSVSLGTRKVSLLNPPCVAVSGSTLTCASAGTVVATIVTAATAAPPSSRKPRRVMGVSSSRASADHRRPCPSSAVWRPGSSREPQKSSRNFSARAGNYPRDRPDLAGVRCELAREAVSAALDGEDPGSDLAEVLRHQVGCAGCAAWARSWQGVGRRSRLAVAEPVPDLTEAILAAVAADRAVASRSLPRETARRRMLPTRLALVAVALAQLLATWPSLLLGHDHAAPEHLARELGSFGVAVTLGLLVAAAWPSLAAGSLPVLAASGGLLAVTAGLDIAAGR